MSNITSLLAGTELDAVIAQIVFEKTVCIWNGFNHYCRGFHPEPYSSDITAAMSVVTKMRQLGWDFYYHGPAIKDGRLGPSVSFLRTATGKEFKRSQSFTIGASLVRADTDELAICQAALTALEKARIYAAD